MNSSQHAMRYLIIDLEATCCDQNSFPRREMEIIEIGAVLLNTENFEIEGEFQTFVRPILHPTLTSFCTELTSIEQHHVNEAPIFPEAVEDLHAWLKDVEHYVFCSWGNYDRGQFKNDAIRHDIPYPFEDTHINIKSAFSNAFNTRKRFGLKAALRKLGLTMHGTHHRGIDDARNIARVVQHLRLKLHT